jgi:hypothetical protein
MERRGWTLDRRVWYHTHSYIQSKSERYRLVVVLGVS